MTTSSPGSKAATKVIVKAGNVVDRRNIARAAQAKEKARQNGRYQKSIDELAEAVEKYRQTGGAITMDDQIISREALQKRIREKAYIAFITRAGRDSHCMNRGSPAADDFEAEYDRLEAEAQAAPASHAAPAARRHLDLAQAEAA